MKDLDDPDRAVDPSCDQDPRKGCLLALPGNHCEPHCGYLHYHESSHERLRWATEVAGQSEAAIQPCGDERTRQRAVRGGDDVCRGFKSAKIMAQHIVALFLLSRQLLSVQQHYEWGLRSLNPILSRANRLLQDHNGNHDEPPNDVEEAILLIKAVRMNTMSKLTFADARRFQDLCVDLFPGVTVKDIEYAELEIHIREAMEEMKLKDIDTQIAKMLQNGRWCRWALWLRKVTQAPLSIITKSSS